MPEASARLLDALGVAGNARRFADLDDAGRVPAGTKLPPPVPIFPRYVDEETA
jgi:methionyl-tRNA synthetase